MGIAAPLRRDPALLLDEPTAALNRVRSHEVVSLLAREVEAYGAERRSWSRTTTTCC